MAPARIRESRSNFIALSAMLMTGGNSEHTGDAPQLGYEVNKLKGPTQAEVDAIRWRHPFTFPNGVRALGTKGGKPAEYYEEAVGAEAIVAFKYPVQGKTVLDVGARNGYFSVEAIRRGARKVVALDKPTWEAPYQDFEAFELVRKYIAPEIEVVRRDVMDPRSEPVGNFDCVLFLGVMNHLKAPIVCAGKHVESDQRAISSGNSS